MHFRSMRKSLFLSYCFLFFGGWKGFGVFWEGRGGGVVLNVPLLKKKKQTYCKEKEKPLWEITGACVNIFYIDLTPNEKCNIGDYFTIGNIYLLIFIK